MENSTQKNQKLTVFLVDNPDEKDYNDIIKRGDPCPFSKMDPWVDSLCWNLIKVFIEHRLEIKLAKAAAASDAHVDVSPGADVPPSPPDPSSDVPTTEVPSTEFPTDVPSDGAPTGPSTVSPGSTTVPTSSSVPAAETIPASSGTTPETPSSPVRDARKGKGVAVEEPTPTHDKTFKQLEEERLGWEAAQRLQAQELADFEKQRAESLMKDANLARQMSQDFEMTEDQRKRQQEVLASAANYSDAAWDIILARLQANPDLSSTIFGVEFTDDDFAARMVALVNTRRKELAEQRAQERRERPMTPSQLRQYMRTYVKNQGPAVYSTGWTMAQVRKLSPEQLQEEFDKIQRAVAFTRGLKKDSSPISSASSKKIKTGDDDVNVKAPSHGVPQEEDGATPSQNVSREEVAAPSHSQDIPEAHVEVPSQKATIEDVEVPSNVASTAQHTASSLKKVGTKKKRLGRKVVHTSQSTIPIEEGDPDAEHKVCIKYASDADSASDDDTPVNFYAVVDWELLPTGLGSINAFYRKDNSRKCFTSLREILHLVTRADLMTIYGRVMTFYQDKKAAGVGLVLWGDLKVLMDSPEVNDGSDVWKNQHTWRIQSWKLYSFSGVHVLETVSGLVLHMFVDKKYPLSVNLIERMLDHQLEICHGTMGNELTTAVQLIAFLKKQISDSRRPKVHDCCGGLHVADSEFMKVAVFGVYVVMEYEIGFKMLLFNPLVYVVPTGRVKVPTGRYVVPTGKDNVIVSTGRLKVIPAGRTILVLVIYIIDIAIWLDVFYAMQDLWQFKHQFTPNASDEDLQQLWQVAQRKTALPISRGAFTISTTMVVRDVDSKLLEELESMGFSKERSIRALHFSNEWQFRLLMLRYGLDLRLNEVRRLLCSARPVAIQTPVYP
ncbi:anticodon-binding aminoacyl-tRNA synthetase, class 1a [Tanacetum coccineum]|uniref:Anticodon-binding aminoacyl-tRNA synthetase, class 1a n=1 Tax=Tanacetum coccineum TaxID=301880 RepID=A0ABQ5H1X6_9ASTR